jgi:hypothetical protein
MPVEQLALRFDGESDDEVRARAERGQDREDTGWCRSADCLNGPESVFFQIQDVPVRTAVHVGQKLWLGERPVGEKETKHSEAHMSMRALSEVELKAIADEHGIEYAPGATEHAQGIATQLSKVFKMPRFMRRLRT